MTNAETLLSCPLPAHILLQTEDETPLLRQALPGIVPFLMEETEERKNGRTCLSVELYAGAAAYLLPSLRAFADDPFRDDALRGLYRSLIPYFAGVGYAIDPRGALRYYHAYRADAKPGGASAMRAKIPRREGVSVLLLQEETLAALPCGLTLSPPLLYTRWRRRSDLPCAVAVEDGKILAAAAVGDAEEGTRVREITVETAVHARGRGLGTAVTACLAAELLRQGFSCAYCHSRWNRASGKIARSLGFRHTGRFYAVSGSRL